MVKLLWMLLWMLTWFLLLWRLTFERSPNLICLMNKATIEMVDMLTNVVDFVNEV